MEHKSKFSTYDVVVIGLMGAMVFVTTAFLKIQIPTPAGPTMFKIGNIFCLLAGLLFGGLRGGLAAGIGSALYDLTNPVFVYDAPWTFIRFFLIAFLCGLIAHWGEHSGENNRLNLVAAIAGSGFSTSFYLIKAVTELVLEGSAFDAAVAACSVKMVTSGINAVLAVAASVLIAPACRKALVQAGLGERLNPVKT